MNGTRCKICRKPMEMEYAVQRDKPLPLCGKCFGTWAPHELNQLLGVVPDDGIPVSLPKEEAHVEAVQ